MNICLLKIFLSCKKESHLWNDWDESDSVILCGDPDLETDYSISPSLPSSKILYLKCPDTYEGLPYKMICAFNAILNCDEFSKYNFFWKLDPIDTRHGPQRTKSLVKLLSSGNNTGYLGKAIGPGDKPPLRKYHYNKVTKGCPWDNVPFKGIFTDYILGGNDCGSAGYILSRDSLNIIRNTYSIKDKNLIDRCHIYEDLMIGRILKASNVLPQLINY